MSGKQATVRRFWTPFRVVLTLIVLVLCGALLVSSCNSNDASPKRPTTSTSTSAVPRTAGPLNALPPNVLDAELLISDGPKIKLSDYAGKVLLINLWATWCGPCRMETPELVKLHKEFQGKGVEMIALSTENPEASAESVREFVKEFKVDYQVGWAPQEVALTLMQGRTSIPQSFIIARDGRITKRFIGYSPAIMPQVKRALEEALNSTASSD